jgi:hypothetical protein
MKLLTTAALLALAFIMAGCTTLDQLSAGYHVATSATITRNQAITVATTLRTLQDFAQVQINACIAAKSYSGLCAPAVVEGINKPLLAARAARDNLLAFADQHAGAELGAGGLYDAAIAAKDALVKALQTYGYAVPAG